LKLTCPVCGGASGSCDDSYCRPCKGAGEIEAVCECGRLACVIRNDTPLCADCAAGVEEQDEDSD
jgi:hypothetical protein